MTRGFPVARCLRDELPLARSKLPGLLPGTLSKPLKETLNKT